MKYEIKTINGIKVLLLNNPESNSLTTEIFVKAGSIYENKNNNGIAHFLEHMFFKGGKKYKTPKEVAQAVEVFGGEFNAFTSNWYAGYYVKSAPDYGQKALDVLSDMLVNAQFPENEMEREKGVVIQEIMMYEDNPQALVRKKRENQRFGDNPRGRSILGPQKNVQNFTKKDLENYKQNLYCKDNLLIVLSGNLKNLDKLENQINNLFKDLPKHKKIKEPNLKFLLPKQKTNFYDKKTQQNHLIISAKGFEHKNDKKYAANILSTILGGNMSSRLFQKIREKLGLCYYIGSSHYAEPNNGTFTIYAGIDKERFDMGIEKIYEEIDFLVKNGFDKEEFENAKGYIIGQLQMGLETTDSFANFYGKQYLLYDEIKELPEIIDKYKKITHDEVNSLLSYLSKDNLYLYYIK